MRYLLQRILVSTLLIYLVTTIIFFLVHLLPGSPYALIVNQLIHQGYTRVQAEQQAAALFGYSVSEPLVKQYWHYIGGLVHGNLGTSVMYPGQSVATLIARALPWTVFLVSIALLVSFAVGTLLGTLAAYFRGSWLDHLITFGASLLNGVPQYLTALLLFYFLAVIAGLFPMGGAYSTEVTPGLNLRFILSALYYAALPMAAFVLSSFAGWALSMRGNTISVLGEDFITAARAMAIDSHDVLFSYVGRNAILPLFTGLVLSMAFMFGGSVFVEQVFNYPGLGRLFIDGTNNRDYPLMQGCFLLLTTAVILANLVADLLYSRIDPRIS